MEKIEVLRTCTLHPPGVPDAGVLIPLAQSAYDDEVHNWSAQNLGMVHYRAGKFEQAQERIEEALKLADWYLFWPTLAMCHHQQGRTDEARKWLDKANELFRRVTQTDSNPLTVTMEPAWQDWAYFEVMLQEANELIGEKN
jgi:tetratricopeptide (TPR) repeat protein